MKVIFYSTRFFEKESLRKFNFKNYELSFVSCSLNKSSAQLSQKFDVVSINTADDASSEVLDILKSNDCNLIVTRTSGYDHIDISHAKHLGIKVANIPSYSPQSIAEHAIALLLCLSKNLIKANNKILKHDFSLDGLLGFNLADKTVGIIGTGSIGRAFMKIIHGFGSKVLAYDLEEDLNYLY